MTVKNNEPLSIAEVTEYVDKDAEVVKFIKRFTKISAKEAKDLRKKIEALELMKTNPENISKIIDFLPENAEDLNKIFVGVNLDEDESKKILDTIKEFK